VLASIRFPPDVYKVLERITKENKVSLASLVREAAEQHPVERWPLFKGQE